MLSFPYTVYTHVSKKEGKTEFRCITERQSPIDWELGIPIRLLPWYVEHSFTAAAVVRPDIRTKIASGLGRDWTTWISCWGLGAAFKYKVPISRLNCHFSRFPRLLIRPTFRTAGIRARARGLSVIWRRYRITVRGALEWISDYKDLTTKETRLCSVARNRLLTVAEWDHNRYDKCGCLDRRLMNM